MNRQLLYFLGMPLSPLYSALMRIRAWLYCRGIFRVTRLDVPVISVGNLTMGGTGKTPVVQYISKMLLAIGKHPAVISRGYRGKAKARVNVVSDGSAIMLSADEAGDEPRLLAETLQGVPVLTGRARKFPAAKALELGADVLVLDDGFQHLALGRTVDLVLFNTDILAGNSRVFPGGDLREPVKALNRCQAFVITNVCERNRERAYRFKELLLSRFPKHPVFLAEFNPIAAVLYEKGAANQQKQVDCLRGLPLFGFAGIARPEAFGQTLRDLTCNIVGFEPLADHFQYTAESLAGLFRNAEQMEAVACITTEKDMAKLKELDLSMPIYALQMGAAFGNDFDSFIVERLA